MKLNFGIVEEIFMAEKTHHRGLPGEAQGHEYTNKIIATDRKVDIAYPVFTESKSYSNISKCSFSPMSKTISFKELTPILLKLLQNTKEEGIHPNPS